MKFVLFMSCKSWMLKSISINQSCEGDLIDLIVYDMIGTNKKKKMAEEQK